MRPSLDQQNAFLACEPVAGLAFIHNEYVRVVGGVHQGNSGSLLSIEELGADPIYLVELESNQDALIAQSFLQRAEA